MLLEFAGKRESLGKTRTALGPIGAGHPGRRRIATRRKCAGTFQSHLRPGSSVRLAWRDINFAIVEAKVKERTRESLRESDRDLEEGDPGQSLAALEHRERRRKERKREEKVTG